MNLGARASGLGQAANGVGKILGPLSLALIAGTSNILSPKATADAVLPAYLFLAFCMALVGLSFLILGVETHGRAMGVGADADFDPAAAVGARHRGTLRQPATARARPRGRCRCGVRSCPNKRAAARQQRCRCAALRRAPA